MLFSVIAVIRKAILITLLHGNKVEGEIRVEVFNLIPKLEKLYSAQ